MMGEPLLPQRATEVRAEVLSVDWLFEPLWPGTRLMARVDGRDVTLSDELGQPLEEDAGEIIAVLAGAILARQAVLDAVWTAQPFVGDGSLARTWAETIEAEGLAHELPDPLQSERRRALVVVDLVELDDEPLADVPFLERRRLLESVVDPGMQLRLSPVVKQPIGGWLIGWRTNGFSHYLAKHQNSRYVMGERNEEWLKLPLRIQSSQGVMGRLVGSRERVRRIRD